MLDEYFKEKKNEGIASLDDSSPLMDKLGKGFVFIANVSNNKVTFIAKSNTNIHAGKIAKEAAIITGGNGGGFEPPIKWVEENLIKKGKDLACMIYFTDGGANDPEKPKWHRKMIWAMTTSHKMPFGKHVNVPVNKLGK